MDLKIGLISGAAVAVGLLFAGWWIYDSGYDNGVAYVNETVANERIQWQAKINELQANNDTTVATITANHKTTVEQLNKQIETLKANPKIVTKYITKTTPCTVTNGFALLHDRAATNVPLTTMVPDNVDQPSEYSLDDVANTVAINYHDCNVCLDRLKALQEIIKQYQNKQQQAIQK